MSAIGLFENGNGAVGSGSLMPFASQPGDGCIHGFRVTELACLLHLDQQLVKDDSHIGPDHFAHQEFKAFQLRFEIGVVH